MEVWVIESLPSNRFAGAASRLGNEGWSRVLYFVVVGALIVNIGISAAWVISAFDGLKDLDSFLHSGAAYARGLDPYEYYWWLRPEPISPEALNLNPPISIYLFEPLSSMDRGMLGAGFMVSAIAMVAVAVGLLMRAYPEKRHWILILVVAAMAGIWHMLWYMQIYAPLLLAMTGAWLLLRRGDWLLAGILIGFVIAVKPNYGLVALVMVAAGHYRPAIASVVTAGLVSLVPVIVDGPHIYWQWLHLTQGFDGYGWTSNASLVSVGERMGIVQLGQLAAAAMAAALLFLAWRWRPDSLTAVAIGTMCVILVGPVSWAGYTLMLLPYLFSIRWDGWTWAAVALLVWPFAPAKALGSLGFGASSVEGSAGFAQSIVPEPVLTVFGAIAVPVVGAIYAWAVMILLVRLCQRLAAEHGERMPSLKLRLPWSAVPPRRPRLVRPAVRPMRPAMSPERTPGAVVAVRVRSEM